MDTLMLSRVQFGVSIGVHYLFPVTTLGLSLLILILETLSLRRKAESFRQVSGFLVKLLGLVFTVGVATGLVLPLQVGANWSRFSSFAGPVFGTMLSLEATLAFALESAFLVVLLLGRNRVSPLVLWFSAVCVFIGSHLSAFLIVSANSWMQTPAGFAIENGGIVLTSLMEAVFNPSTPIRFMHVIVAAWLTGSFLACGLAAYYAARKRHAEFTTALFRVAMPVMLLTSLVLSFLGHLHCMNVLEHNPEKSAAFEGVFHSTTGATIYVFGIPDEERRTIHMPVGIPHGLSYLQSGELNSRVRGLDEFPEDTWPPVNVTFTTYHLMVLLGMAMTGVAVLGSYLLWRERLMDTRWYLLALPWLVPLPYLANEFGWIGAEAGRQPWVVYKVLRTAQASSEALPAWQVGVSLAGITAIYLTLLVFTMVFLFRMVRRGPDVI